MLYKLNSPKFRRFPSLELLTLAWDTRQMKNLFLFSSQNHWIWYPVAKHFTLEVSEIPNDCEYPRSQSASVNIRLINSHTSLPPPYVQFYHFWLTKTTYHAGLRTTVSVWDRRRWGRLSQMSQVNIPLALPRRLENEETNFQINSILIKVTPRTFSRSSFSDRLEKIKRTPRASGQSLGFVRLRMRVCA